MTPKEKADELVKKIYKVMSDSVSDITLYFSKQCALIAVNEIMKMPNIGYNHNQDESQYDYWQEVKQEIAKL